MKVKSTWSELLYKCQNQWIETNIHRKTFMFGGPIMKLIPDQFKTEHINNEIKLYEFSNLISTFKYIINLDNITTIYIKNDDGFKTQFTLKTKENKL